MTRHDGMWSRDTERAADPPFSNWTHIIPHILQSYTLSDTLPLEHLTCSTANTSHLELSHAPLAFHRISTLVDAPPHKDALQSSFLAHAPPPSIVQADQASPQGQDLAGREIVVAQRPTTLKTGPTNPFIPYHGNRHQTPNDSQP